MLFDVLTKCMRVFDSSSLSCQQLLCPLVRLSLPPLATMMAKRDVIQNIVKESVAKARDTGAVVQAVKLMMSRLEEIGVAYTLRMAPELVGIHNMNRAGLGVDAARVHRLLLQIVDLGWDDAVPVPVAVDLSDEAESVEQHAFNKTVVDRYASSSTPLAPLDHDLKLVALGANHTNQALRLVAAGMPHADEKITVGGNLSLGKVYNMS